MIQPSNRLIVAMGGGGFSMEPDNPLLDDHVLALARANRDRDRPRVCFVGTASGDAELVEVVASRPAARGYRVVRGPAGQAIETELPTRYLG